MNNNCPECGEKPVTTCRCMMADSTCKNGHKWHTCVMHGIKVKGHGDHSGNSDKCSCGGSNIIKMVCPIARDCPHNGKGCEGTHSSVHDFQDGVCNRKSMGQECICPDCIPAER